MFEYVAYRAASVVEVIELANNTEYGLACAVFTENISRGIRVAHALEAGTAWVCRFLCRLKAVLINIYLSRSTATTRVRRMFHSEVTSNPAMVVSWVNTPWRRKSLYEQVKKVPKNADSILSGTLK